MLEFSRYNEAVNAFVEGNKSVLSLGKEKQKEINEIKKNASKEVEAAFKRYIDEVEGKVKDWTSGDYDEFIEMSKNDSRLGSMGILIISSAYAKTHDSDKNRINNNICKSALLDVSIDNLYKMWASF